MKVCTTNLSHDEMFEEVPALTKMCNCVSHMGQITSPRVNYKILRALAKNRLNFNLFSFELSVVRFLTGLARQQSSHVRESVKN